MMRFASALAVAILGSALLLVSPPANAGTVLSASNTEFAHVDDLASFTLETGDIPWSNPPEAYWPYCELQPEIQFQGCARRVVTLGPGRIEDVNITVDWSGGGFPAEMDMWLSHGGVHTPLIHQGSVSEHGTGGLMTFDDEAANPLPPSSTSGTFRPDGFLGVFDGLDAAGEWILTLQDCCNDDPRFFHSMTLQVTVPEPSSIGLLISALAGLGFARRRKPH